MHLLVAALVPFQLAGTVLVAALPQSLPRPSSDTAHIVLVATTDVHGRVRGWDYVRDQEAPGGLARAATVLETLRARYPERVVLVDAGDLLQGNPFAAYFATEGPTRPHPIIDALNVLGYDAATPGNHEFDFGVEPLERAVSDAAFPYVSANVFREGSDALAFQSHAVVVRGGVKVGITGFTTPGVMVWDRAQVAGRIRVRPVGQSAAAALGRLEQTGADLKIVLIHAGLGSWSSYDTSGVGAENGAASLAAVVPRPDLVIVGHSHREIRDTVINGVHFVQPKYWAQSLSVVHVRLVRGTQSREQGAVPFRYRVVTVRAELIQLATVPEQSHLIRRVEAAHQRVRAWAATPLGTAGPGFDGRLGRAQDTPLLDFINAVQRRRTGADLSATALFEVGPGLPEGEVRLRDLAGVYPYENTLRAVRISGEQLREFLEHSSRYYRTYEAGRSIVEPGVPGYNFDVVSGLCYTIDLSQPVGRRVRMTYRGRPVAPTDSFTLALNSYRQEGGGGYTMLQGAPVVYDRGESLRDLLVAEIRRAGMLDAREYFEANWAIVPAEAEQAAVEAFAAPSRGR